MVVIGETQTDPICKMMRDEDKSAVSVFVYEKPLHTVILNPPRCEKKHQMYIENIYLQYILVPAVCPAGAYTGMSRPPTEERWEQMAFPVNSITHVTVLVKDVCSNTSVPGCTDECQRNCKILSRVSSLFACCNNQQRCHFVNPANTIKSHFFSLPCRSPLKWK